MKFSTVLGLVLGFFSLQSANAFNPCPGMIKQSVASIANVQGYLVEDDNRCIIIVDFNEDTPDTPVSHDETQDPRSVTAIGR